MPLASISLTVWVAGIATLGAVLGARLASVARLARRMLPFGAGVLIGVALFFLLPELAGFFHWTTAVGWFAAGFLLLGVIDRYVKSICPSCSHTHDHLRCGRPLHGFATPLLLAAAIHSLLDGWAIGAAAHTGSGNLGLALVAAIALHKIPEGIALGMLAQAALDSPVAALAGCAAAESATVAGAVLETSLASQLGAGGVHLLLALAGGAFLYLGYHAVHAEYRQTGAGPAFTPALTGVAGAAAIWLFSASHRLFA